MFMAPDKGTYAWRKAFELTGVGHEAKATICLRKGSMAQKDTQKSHKSNTKGPTELTIRTEGRTFAQMVAQLQADDCLTGLSITRVAETRDGALKIRATGENIHKELSERIGQRIDGAEIETGRRKLLECSDLVQGTRDEDVIGAIKEAAGRPIQATLVAIGDTGRGTWRAKVLVPEEAVERILSAKVKVGLVTTSFRRPPDRCSRCMRTGHEASKCKGQDWRNTCFKCQKKGHLARSCTSTIAEPPA